VKTALGAVRVERSHGYCRVCTQPQFAADRLLGLDGWLTTRAWRMACLAGIHDPFRQAEQLLDELSGWSVDAETIRRHCHAAAADARQQRGERAGLPVPFRQAEGDRELHIDAGKVNTPDGWRDVKVAVFACRGRAAAASAAAYEQRDLPAPTVRAVVAEVEEAQSFGPRCQAEAERLGVSAAAGLSVLGDGAEWIWNLATDQFDGATQVLDVYHGVEHLAAAARHAFGEGAALEEWLEDARRRLVGDGYWGVCDVLAEPLPDEAARRRLDEKAAETLNYFCGHQDRLGYAVRLRRGQAIGSGLVEGTIKQRVNVRMKRSGARWQPGQVGPFVELMAMADSPEWSEFWADMAA
jgi:hypothetical protein